MRSIPGAGRQMPPVRTSRSVPLLQRIQAHKGGETEGRVILMEYCTEYEYEADGGVVWWKN